MEQGGAPTSLFVAGRFSSGDEFFSKGQRDGDGGRDQTLKPCVGCQVESTEGSPGVRGQNLLLRSWTLLRP